MPSLSATLRARIEADGPLSIAEYMEAALLDTEDGYYTTRMPFGREGDFITAPEISQIFGELTGAWLADCWMKLGSPRAALVECGPGRGTLMRDILRATRRISGFHEHMHIIMVEASEGLAALQRRALEGAHPRMHWQRELTPLPALPTLLVANEWLDALPIRQFMHTADGWYERLITTGDAEDQFAFTLNKTPLPGGEGSVRFAHAGEGSIFETCQPATEAIHTLATHLIRHGGATLLVDYGYTEHAPGDTLQAVKNHAFHDPLRAPGTADITAHVNFAALKEAALTAGAAVHGPVPQGIWLKRLGAELRAMHLCKNATLAQREAVLSGLARLVSPAAMGELFKMLAITSPDITTLEGFA